MELAQSESKARVREREGGLYVSFLVVRMRWEGRAGCDGSEGGFKLESEKGKHD